MKTLQIGNWEHVNTIRKPLDPENTLESRLWRVFQQIFFAIQCDVDTEEHRQIIGEKILTSVAVNTGIVRILS
jgi:hypothetical protein